MRKLVGEFGRIFVVAMVFALGFFGTAQAAKPLQKLVWAHDVYTMGVAGDDQTAQRRRGYQLMNTGTPEQQKQNRDKIANAIDAKLKEQGAKLPFELVTSFSGDTDEINAKFNENDALPPVALVPIVVIDYAIEQVYQINGTPHYKYIIISAVDIAFCSEDSNGFLTILGNIPLHFYESLPLSNSIEQMTHKERTELADIYASFTADMIKKNLDFTKYKKIINTLQTRQLGTSETYRVENVSYTSKIANDILGKNRLMQRICGNIFTSDFAALTGNVVYPMLLKDDTSNWTIDAKKGMYVARMVASHSGENKEIGMPTKVDHEIYLNVSGAGSKDVETKQTSNINGFKAYRLWMESTVGGKKIEVTNDITEEYLKDNTTANKIIKGEAEIYGGLMIGAAVKSAAAQAGKKVK